jgi:RNA polymerase sigma-70 factor (ECF subfamily)
VADDPAPRTEAELLAATLAGDEHAFLEIYRRHRDRIFGFAYRMTGSADLARDVTHDCFVSLLEDPRRYEAGRAGLGTYLCAAARNQSLRHASRAWRERPHPDARDLRPSPEPGPLEQLMAEETSDIVRRAVGALPPLHREVLILAEYEELDLATIATVVGAEVGAVKVRLHRARKRLRRALEAGLAPSAAPSRRVRIS